MPLTAPIPKDEFNRIIDLSSFDLDYSELKKSFSDLTLLASKITKTEVSLINLIDSYTQWTISNKGLDVDSMPREESVCQHTIVSEEYFEVKDLKADERFNKFDYVSGAPDLGYYFGVPLTTSSGHNLGALCVLDKKSKELDPEKIEMLKIIANEIVKRLEVIKNTQELEMKIREARETQKKLAHDIRGPLSGIVGLAKLIVEQGNSNSMDDIVEINELIHKGGMSILELADEILSKEKRVIEGEAAKDDYNLKKFKEKLEKLYSPQALHKKINFSVTATNPTAMPFPKNKLLQITGNLISNAIKFTPAEGEVSVNLDLLKGERNHSLDIVVKDSGIGIDKMNIGKILHGNIDSSDGTVGEQGYGFGLALVKHLVEDLKGTIHIHSNVGEGATFNVILPQLN